jgi:L-seryl-tRNA(Ser) seleniumtransferase
LTSTDDHPDQDPTTRRLPAVDAVLREAGALIDSHGRRAATNAIRWVLEDARQTDHALDSAETVIEAAARLATSDAPQLKPLFNLTGTILHTNLGRALLAKEAIAAATDAMRAAVGLEYDLASGRRGERDDAVRALLCELTGAEDATLVNNNAAAVLLTLNTLAKGKGVIVSRGELIEIGGAFRLPEIMKRAGTRLVEVGTTNRTHVRDYQEALTEGAGMILKVHTSNYRIEGFTHEVTARELAPLAAAHGVPLVDDLGSGTLIDLAPFGLPREPTVAQAVAAGADLVTFSGDKLLGGPQAGFIVGRKALIARLNRNPMKRALRVDKIRLAAIAATLRLYRHPEQLAERLPTFRALARPLAEIDALAQQLRAPVAAQLGPSWQVEVTPCASQVGSGALPTDTLPSMALRLAPVRSSGRAIARLAGALRQLPCPIIGRVHEGALLLDLRCLEDAPAFLASLDALRLP